MSLVKESGSDPKLDMPTETEGNRHFKLKSIQPVSLDEEEDEFDYEQVSVDFITDDSDSMEEDLEQAVRNIHQRTLMSKEEEERQAQLERKPELVDDFIRNFLANKALTRTLDCFQNEWYELIQKGKLGPEDIDVVPDLYQRNQELLEAVARLRVDVTEYREIANKARSTYDRLRKERDFHRMHHKRVIQEKNKLIAEIKRMKKHYDGYDPTLKQLQVKYEAAMKEKMLTKLERDRLVGKIEALESSMKQNDRAGDKSTRTEKLLQLPAEDRPNPYATMTLPVAKVDTIKQRSVFKAHEMAVSSVKFHPKKMVLATVSDDRTWKLWTFPGCEPVMSGSGHKEWIADCDFHPKGAMLATASGDGSVKIWDFSRGQATMTMHDHNQGVWSCAFHDQGDFLASCSMDQTAKLWDLKTGKCRQTFRGHADSVNHLAFVPYTNTMITCSGDKTVSAWDVRAGICSQTFYGHLTAVNRIAVSLKGDQVATCDADGVVKFWDLRNTSEVKSVEFGPHSANSLTFDPSGTILAVASNDGSTKMLFNTKSAAPAKDLYAHDEGVQAVAFDRSAEYFVTAGADGMVKLWQ